MQSAAATPEYVPASQLAQLLEPVLLACVPASQFVQLNSPAAAAIVPAGQSEQLDAPPVDTVPLPQSMQLDDPALLVFPPSQLTHTTAEPRPNAYIPDDIGIPKPYGALAPFKPTELGATMRHIRRPNPREIEL